ncbi:MAG: tetratricopeptide repeat protein, partial [Conexibacter sp.]
VVVAGLVAAWTIWQPQRSVDASDAALATLFAGHPQDALADAQDAVDLNPLSIDPLLTLAAVQRANRQPEAARATLQRVVRLQPANPESWLRLGQFELDAGHARRALRLLGAAIYLDPRGPEAQTAYAQAQQTVAQKQAAARAR